MSQSRKRGYKVTMPSIFKRENCREKAKTEFQFIPCENSGRVGPQVTKSDDESPVK